MWAEMTGFIEVSFTGACLPATLVLILAAVYWLLAVVAGLELELFDFDLDFDGEPDLHSVLGMGMVVLRFLNIGRVPMMVWASVFAIVLWTVTLLLDRMMDDPTSRTELLYTLQYVVRNVVFGLLITKGITQPLRDKFEPVEPNRAEELIGRSCHITTSEVTERFGQAQVATDAAPLILDVRARHAPLAKGEAAIIVDYDPNAKVYFIETAEAEV
ncbi:MAG: DUF1449 family protein [Patescibacteria group bacterium]|nr:DUF1449 family protein [Patescibacteria group bacterium]